MLPRTIKCRAFSSGVPRLSKVAVLGAAGGIGQPLSLLLKLNPRVSKLALYDLKGSVGVAADVSHINTKSKVDGYTPDKGGIAKTLDGAHVVLIPAGLPRKPGMSRNDLFQTNAGIVHELVHAVAQHSPHALVLVISNPVNSTVPIAAEVLKARGVYDARRLMGVTTLDVLRAAKFVSELKNTDPAAEHVTVVGGHSGITIVPLLSQSGLQDVSGDQYDKLVHRIQFGGDEVVKAKDGAGSATLSMAQAGARFCDSVLRGLAGEPNVVEPSFVDSPLFKSEGIDFFSSRVTLGPHGVAQVHGLGALSARERDLVETAKADLKKNIQKGVQFAASAPKPLL